nr:hypothetical protein GCM10025732_22980 [Glycomyces mayteni]
MTDEATPVSPATDPHVYGGPPARSPRTVGRDLLAAGVLAVVLTALGFPAAMLWQIVTPRVEFVVVDGGWLAVETYPDGYVEGDLMFAGIGLVLGIAAAVFAWSAMRERRGPILLLGLVIGSIASQVVAWKIGANEWQQFWDAVERAPAGVHMFRPRRSCSSSSTPAPPGTRSGSGISQRPSTRSSSAHWPSWPSPRPSLTPSAPVGHVARACERTLPNSGMPFDLEMRVTTLGACSDASTSSEPYPTTRPAHCAS